MPLDGYIRGVILQLCNSLLVAVLAFAALTRRTTLEKAVIPLLLVVVALWIWEIYRSIKRIAKSQKEKAKNKAGKKEPADKSAMLLVDANELLIPGTCECGHRRCFHHVGNGVCAAKTAVGERCACQIYIFDEEAVPLPENPVGMLGQQAQESGGLTNKSTTKPKKKPDAPTSDSTAKLNDIIPLHEHLGSDGPEESPDPGR